MPTPVLLRLNLQRRGAMARAQVTRLLSLSRRGYAASAGAERASAMAARVSAAEGATGREIFWMRDPKTGNWIPENRFAEVDAAELRAQLLSRKGTPPNPAQF